jgi:hypothetical protein
MSDVARGASLALGLYYYDLGQQCNQRDIESSSKRLSVKTEFFTGLRRCQEEITNDRMMGVRWLQQVHPWKKFQHPVPEKRRRDIGAATPPRFSKDPIVDAGAPIIIGSLLLREREQNRARAYRVHGSSVTVLFAARNLQSAPFFQCRRRRRFSTLGFPLRRIVSSVDASGGEGDGKI